MYCLSGPLCRSLGGHMKGGYGRRLYTCWVRNLVRWVVEEDRRALAVLGETVVSRGSIVRCDGGAGYILLG